MISILLFAGCLGKGDDGNKSDKYQVTFYVYYSFIQDDPSEFFWPNATIFIFDDEGFELNLSNHMFSNYAFGVTHYKFESVEFNEGNHTFFVKEELYSLEYYFHLEVVQDLHCLIGVTVYLSYPYEYLGNIDHHVSENEIEFW